MKIIYQRDSSGFTVREEKLRWFGHVIMMDIPPPPKQQEKRKEKEEVRACIEAGHAAG